MLHLEAHEALLAACEDTYLRLLQYRDIRLAMQAELAALRDAIALARSMEPEDVQRSFESRARQQA